MNTQDECNLYDAYVICSIVVLICISLLEVNNLHIHSQMHSSIHTYTQTQTHTYKHLTFRYTYITDMNSQQHIEFNKINGVYINMCLVYINYIT